jgi:hypothetical protein
MPILKVTVNIPSLENLVFSTAQLERGCLDTVNQVLDQADKDFAQTYSTFTTKPTFTKVPARNQSGVIRGEVFTTNENYRRLDQGTTKHDVGLRRQLMAFHPARQNKTIPGYVGSQRGGPLVGTGPRGKHGAKLVRRGPWEVGGIEPRKFSETVGWRAMKNLQIATAKMLSQLLK